MTEDSTSGGSGHAPGGSLAGGFLRLQIPSERHSRTFFHAMEEFAEEGIPQLRDGVSPATFADYLQRLEDQAAGRNLPEGHVPSQEFWMVDEEGFAGRIILGLAIPPGSGRLGNHVGYAVRPSRRRRGYAAEALRLLMLAARERGISALELECGVDNVASRRVIERNGGVLASQTPGGVDGRALRFLIVP